jgi:hypothetical protein
MDEEGMAELFSSAICLHVPCISADQLCYSLRGPAVVARALPLLRHQIDPEGRKDFLFHCCSLHVVTVRSVSEHLLFCPDKHSFFVSEMKKGIEH